MRSIVPFATSGGNAMGKANENLWVGEPQPCPLCGGVLDFMHKKAKKSNSNWKCTSCGKVYKAIDILEELPDR